MSRSHRRHGGPVRPPVPHPAPEPEPVERSPYRPEYGEPPALRRRSADPYSPPQCWRDPEAAAAAGLPAADVAWLREEIARYRAAEAARATQPNPLGQRIRELASALMPKRDERPGPAPKPLTWRLLSQRTDWETVPASDDGYRPEQTIRVTRFTWEAECPIHGRLSQETTESDLHEPCPECLRAWAAQVQQARAGRPRLTDAAVEAAARWLTEDTHGESSDSDIEVAARSLVGRLDEQLCEELRREGGLVR